MKSVTLIVILLKHSFWYHKLHKIFCIVIAAILNSFPNITSVETFSADMSVGIRILWLTYSINSERCFVYRFSEQFKTFISLQRYRS